MSSLSRNSVAIRLKRRAPVLNFPLGVAIPPVLQRIYANRGIEEIQDLDLGLAGLADYRKLKGIEQAVELLWLALKEQWRILIVGDYDADGATSTALALRSLGAMGALHLDYLVPNRFTQGYGLTPELVESALSLAPQLIMTVDNGIAANEGVIAAQNAGIKVLVTDHHLQGDILPLADAIVNPNQSGDEFPSKSLSGVGVVFYLMSALRARLRDSGWFNSTRPEPRLAELLDLVALGTVADVVKLDRNNRILVEQGLRRIRAGRCCPGILSLLRIAGRDTARVNAIDIGFFVGPRINAAGRMDDMSIGIECLLTDDVDRAQFLASRLDMLNRERREVEQDIREIAMSAAERIAASVDFQQVPAGLCLYDPEWHEGVLGLVASRIKDRFHRPTVILSTTENGILKGSARSIPGINIRDVLATLDAENPGLILRFGGHAMAAGLTIDAALFDDFSTRFARMVSRYAEADMMQPIIWSDGELAPDEFDVHTAEILHRGGPWGQGFPEPLFDGVFLVQSVREVGKHHLQLDLCDPRNGAIHKAIAFNYAEHDMSLEIINDKVRIAFRLGINDYRGRTHLQLVIEGYDLPIVELTGQDGRTEKRSK